MPVIHDHELHKIGDGKIVVAGGCFDILHPAHVEFLKKAKALGDNLVILLESDENIKKLKGQNRPLNSQNTRAENLSKLSIADYIILLSIPETQDYYYNLVKLLQPAIIAVTEGDPLLGIKKEQAKLVGGKVVTVMSRNEKYSTSKIAQK